MVGEAPETSRGDGIRSRQAGTDDAVNPLESSSDDPFFHAM